ncbi:hypothetical protein FCV43_14890 [Vibrio genomosp. F6]|uniref:hypothetical protein n=1 Tax=Vibrio genomosp. F6 TaxID=723172 RepID=UPI0010BDBA43|nr:hypothetical protein [Vibrio genomosp. F6]TKF19742.1 hypothetical protein FCV43_14890 [Vibrio genomosp. F6]
MKITKTAVALCMILGVSGCQSTSESVGSKSETNQEGVELFTSAFEVSQAQYQKWETELQGFEGLKIYAPENFSELNSAWKEASEIYQELRVEPSKINKSYSMFSSETYAEALTEQLSIVEASYQALTALKAKADTILADAIAQMDYLETIEADKIYNRQFNSLYRKYKALFEYVVVDELEEAQEAQVEFLNQAKSLEIKVVQKKFIQPLKVRLVQLRKNDLNDIAVTSFATATAQIKLAESTVTANPRDLKSIEGAVAAANFELEHVKNVAHQVKLLASVEDEHFEPAVLEIENRLLAISKAVDGSDYRDQVLRVQAKKIVASIENLHNEDQTESLQKQLKVLTSELAEAKLQNERNVTLLAEQVKQKDLLTSQVSRSEAHIQSLEELVANFKSQAAQTKPEPEAIPADSAVNAQEDAPLETEAQQIVETPLSEEVAVTPNVDLLPKTSKVAKDIVAPSI